MMQHDLKKTEGFHLIYFMHDILCLFSDFLVDVPNFFFDFSRARSNLPGNLSMSSWVRELEDCRRVGNDHLDLLCEVII